MPLRDADTSKGHHDCQQRQDVVNSSIMAYLGRAHRGRSGRRDEWINRARGKISSFASHHKPHLTDQRPRDRVPGSWLPSSPSR
jgi:hypothetical protein